MQGPLESSGAMSWGRANNALYFWTFMLPIGKDLLKISCVSLSKITSRAVSAVSLPIGHSLHNRNKRKIAISKTLVGSLVLKKREHFGNGQSVLRGGTLGGGRDGSDVIVVQFRLRRGRRWHSQIQLVWFNNNKSWNSSVKFRATLGSTMGALFTKLLTWKVLVEE